MSSEPFIPHARRPRRLRTHPALRRSLSETNLGPEHLIQGVFVTHGQNKKEAIDPMPGIYRWSIDRLGEHLDELQGAGIDKLMLFGIPEAKDARGSGADAGDGIMQTALAAAKKSHPDLCLIADACFCEYTDHGHCGILHDSPEVTVDNDQSLDRLASLAVSLAEAGADMIAPSGMMDGTVAVVREALDRNNFGRLPIMMYSVKYAGAFYGPFRDAAGGAPQFGDRRSYQMNMRNRREALVEAELDVLEGADILMVKPALSYLDIISDLYQHFQQPIAAYNVSGEYAMIKAAANQGVLDEMPAVTEILTSMRRAGASLIVTYHALAYGQYRQSANQT